MFSHKIDNETEISLIELRDAEELNALVTNNFEHLRAWSGWLKVKERPVEQTRDWIKRNKKRFGSGDGFEMAVRHRGRLAGQIGYNYFDYENLKTEIGYWLGSSFQGKGLITKACGVAIDNAFGEFGLNRIEIRCGSENWKSRKIPERLGFREEGTARQAEWLHHRFIDLVVYSMLASDWDSNVYNAKEKRSLKL
ncbi:MAG TPA: GNAT family N-acetyltransferase [Pyrinomonadaceae bacterium]|nr:GNAT family N-acetyltransferase [Pyrinomonadaceae bacterium]